MSEEPKVVSTLKKEHCVLFDMDGTLTLPRKEITDVSERMLETLYTEPRCSIGIVSGSPLEYIRQQMGESLFLNPEKTMLMPCNGTQLLTWDSEASDYELRYETDMKKHMTPVKYNQLITHIVELQAKFIAGNADFASLTGHFVSYRKSMVNWSPVGREAETLQREAFIGLDKKFKVREKLRDSLAEHLRHLKLCDIDLKLGGSTSIDIHPSGWDKTHALKHCKDKTVWFIGDKCKPGGNDHSLWAHLNDKGRSFETNGPENTSRIVVENILPCIQSS